MARPSLMIAIGLPHAHGGEGDEDNLNREGDAGGGDNDLAAHVLVSIVHRLHRGGPSAVRDLRSFTQALEELADTHMAKDSHGFEDAAGDACNALEALISK